MINIEHEKEMVFVKLIRKGPHLLEFSDDYLMIHNGRIALATLPVIEQYFSALKEHDSEMQDKFLQTIAELIDNEYYNNKSLEWYSLRDYIANFDVKRLEELKRKIC